MSKQDIKTIEHHVTIIDNRRQGDLACVLTLDAPDVAVAAKPGQFVNLSSNKFLKRPFGIMDADPATGTIQVGIRLQGEGTAWLCRQAAGTNLDLVGPLGHGFDLDGLDRVITVGGGTGVFPLYFVQKKCLELGIESIAVCGYRSAADQVIGEDYRALSCPSLFSSDAGDLDIPGHAGQALEQLLEDIRPGLRTAILTCGPKIMMKTVADIARQHQLPCQVSLEERMACGIGVCLVCVCRIKDDSKEGYSHQRCCVEGPVFAAEVVEW